MENRILLIRTAALLVPVCWLLVGLFLVKPRPRQAGALLLAFLWNLPSLVLVNMAALHFHWWSFDAQGAMFFGIPVDLLLGWAVLWGPLAGIGVLYVSPWIIIPGAICLDLLVMPACQPVVVLNENWLAGEAAAVGLCLLPAVWLARWTVNRQRLAARATLQMVLFAGLFLFLIPAMALYNTGARLPVRNLATSIGLQFLVFAALPGIAALQEFVQRGRGTPYPYDPTACLVTTGPYAYVRNPMQISTALMLLVMAVVMKSTALVAASFVTVAYSAGLAWWHESLNFAPRWGDEWKVYRDGVSNWIPRWRPWRSKPARLYIAASCETCQKVQGWLLQRDPVSLEIVPAEHHPERDLFRVTYEDGNYRAEGVAAFARALEHIDIRWALVSFFLRLPILNSGFQLLADAVIEPPKGIRRREAHQADG